MTKRTRAANAAALPIEEPIKADPASSAAAILAAAQASEHTHTAPTTRARLATFGDYAAGEFEAIATREDLEQLRPVYEQNRTPLALAMMILAKSSNEVADFAEEMEKNDEGPALVKMIESITASSKWFAQTAELMNTAQIRMLCGMCRSYEAKGLPSEGF